MDDRFSEKGGLGNDGTKSHLSPHDLQMLLAPENTEIYGNDLGFIPLGLEDPASEEPKYFSLDGYDLETTTVGDVLKDAGGGPVHIDPNDILKAQKKSQEGDDRNTAMQIAVWPLLLAMMAEVANSAVPDRNSIGPLPSLYDFLQRNLPEIWQSLPESVRIVLPPAILMTILLQLASKLLGKGINKFRYFARGLQLKKESNKLGGDTYGFADYVIAKFKEYSERMTAREAYAHTKDEMFPQDGASLGQETGFEQDDDSKNWF